MPCYNYVSGAPSFLGGKIMENNTIKLSKEQQQIITQAAKMLAGVIIDIIADNLFGR